MFDHCFTTSLLLSLFWKNLWNCSTFGSVIGKTLTASSTVCAWALSCWKVKKSLDVWHMASRNCCNSVTLRLILLTNLHCMMDKCQTGVMSTTCYSLTDAIHDWMPIMCSSILSWHLFFLVDWCAYNRSFCRFFRHGHCQYFFVSEQNDSNIIGWIFSATV